MGRSGHGPTSGSSKCRPPGDWLPTWLPRHRPARRPPSRLKVDENSRRDHRVCAEADGYPSVRAADGWAGPSRGCGSGGSGRVAFRLAAPPDPRRPPRVVVDRPRFDDRGASRRTSIRSTGRGSTRTRSRIIDKVVEEMTEWCQRPLDRVYPVLFIDAIMAQGPGWAGGQAAGLRGRRGHGQR
ncbi:transposase [Micromonospora sp. 4G55]|nr:transposase [Micromonospora sp. 4G55]